MTHAQQRDIRRGRGLAQLIDAPLRLTSLEYRPLLMSVYGGRRAL